MFKITFIVFLLAEGLPITATIPDRVSFNDTEQCAKYGEQMKSRVADRVRGMINADWDMQIKVDFRCVATGQPT